MLLGDHSIMCDFQNILNTNDIPVLPGVPHFSSSSATEKTALFPIAC